MNRVVKQWLAGLLAVGMAFTLLPATAWAAADYDVAEGSVSLEGDGAYTLTGRTDANTITVTDGNVTLTLDNVTVTSADGCAFDIQGGDVTLILADDSVNTFESGNHYAGIHVAEGASLTIRGNGALYATANKPSENTASGAGIGGNQTDNAGNITIESGTVVAKSDGDGAGIGGGHANDEMGKIYGKFQSITITGGTVTAESTGNGAGIGCGCWAKGMGAISITGGEIHAKSASPNNSSYDIGYGHRDGDFESDISITGGVIFTEGDHQRGIGAGSVSQDDCLIFPYSGQGTCYGDPTLTGDITIPSGRTLTVPADSTLTVAEGATLTVAPGAALEVEGAVRNDGAIDQYGEIDGEIGGNPPVRYELTVAVPSFDSLAEGCDQPEAKPVTIENTGNGTVTISQVELSGGDFILGEGAVGPLAGGASNTTWTVQPAAGLECGHYEAEITVTCEDGVTAADTVSFDVLGAPVPYLDSDGAEKTCEVYRLVKSGETTWREGWYVVRESVTVDSRITVSGDVHLILMDGCILTVNGGINVSEDNALTIYGQTAGTGRLDAIGSQMCGGIGSGQSRPCGAITINGGTIYAKGGQDGAGIGGGSFGAGGIITINGGTVTAEGGHDPSGTYMTGGAGIGGGRESRSGGTITINGGTVTATGCLDSAGIGGGGSSGSSPSSGGDITITGGTVTATGGGETPGIGGGRSTRDGSLGASGSFSTGEDGNAVIHTNNGIQDDSGTDDWSGVVFEEDSGTVYGSPTLTEDLEIQDGQTLTIPEGSTLTVADGATLTNNGGIMNYGTLDNQGTVANSGRIVNDGGATTGKEVSGTQPETPEYNLRVSNVTFEDLAYGTQSEEKEILIRNTGLNDVTIESVTVGKGFVLTAGDGGILAAGARNTSWKIKPQDNLFGGDYTATITVTYSAGETTQTATAEASVTVAKVGDAYEIPNAAALKAFRDYINSDNGHGQGESFALTADIDLGGEENEWTPIGNNTNQFKGTFDGGNFTVSGLFVSSGYDVGLFGYLGEGGTVKNLGVSGSVSGTIAGGIAGENQGTIGNCHNAVAVTGSNLTGGVVGYNNSGTVTNCYNAGTVTGNNQTGGVVGSNSGTVTNCYNTTTVTDNVNTAGGVVGYNNSGTVTNCYNTATVTSVASDDYLAGGVVGNNRGTVTNCYCLTETTNKVVGSGDETGTAVKTPAEFRFLASTLGDGWADDLSLGRPVLVNNREPSPIAGTEADPYLIPDLATLETVRDFVNAYAPNSEGRYFKLTADIDLSSKCGPEKESWTPIGNFNVFMMDNLFLGTFDGGGHTISGLYIGGAGGIAAMQGLFGGNAGTIRDLNVSGTITLRGKTPTAGGIVGMNEGTVTGCASEGSITVEDTTSPEDGAGGMVGGIVGANTGAVTDCVSSAQVTLTATGGESVSCGAGGIVGASEDMGISLATAAQPVVKNCAFSGEVTASISGDAETTFMAGIGGVAGLNLTAIGGTVTVENCANSGAVTGAMHGGESEMGTGVGGVVGANLAMGGAIRVKNCANTGAVSADASGTSGNVGGIVGENISADRTGGGAGVENCCNSGAVTGTGETVSGAVVGHNLVENYSIDYESLMLLPGAATGPSAVKTLSAGAPTALTDAVTNCYYLSGTAAGGIGEGEGQATEKSEAQFASGEVAWLLQSGQDSQVWGQTVGVGYPELTDSEDKTVFQITGVVAGQDPIVWYSNNKATLPAAEPSKANVAFAGWSQTDGGGVDFTAGVAVSGDMTVYAVWKPPLAGSGTAEAPYLIPDKAALEAFRAYVNAGDECTGMYFKLTDDVDLEDELWTPIGDNYTSFNGTFDGGGHTISGVYINTPEYSNIGLFWSVSPDGTIKDLTVSGRVIGLDVVGGIVGYNYGRIENCHNAAAVTGDQDIGGVVGCNCGDVKNCYNTGTVSGNAGVGGVVGNNYAGVENCYNVGTVRGENGAGGVVGQNTNDGRAQNGYYLDACGAAGEGAAKTAEQFASGEVAWLLQNGQDSQVWGQALSADSYPVLTGEPDKRVCKVTFRTESQGEYAVQYVNYNGRAALPAAPALAGMAFDHWSTTNSASGEWFDSATPVTGDITLYAVGRDTFGGESDEIMLTTTCGTALTADLSQYVRCASAPETPAAGKFTYTITGGNETLGAETAGDLLTIPATANAGSYTLTIQTAETEPEYSLMSVESYGTDPVTLTVTVTIAKADPTVTPPTANALTYTGAAQALVEAGSATGGTMQYSLDGTAYSAAIPTGVGAGAYTVWYKVAGDANHNDSAPQSIPVTIAKADPEVTAPTPKTLTYTGAAQELVEAGKTTGGEMRYSLDGTTYSAAIPTGTDAQTYTVWYTVTGDANHNDSAPQSVTVTIAKAEGRGSVTMADYLCGQTDVDPVAQSDTNGTENVTYAYTARGADDYRDTKPTTAGEYTVKAEFPATDNYNAVTATADFKITHRLPSGLDESAEFTCDCASELRLKEEALAQVPPGLSGLYADVETLTRALADQVATGANYAVYDVKLEVKEGAGAWHDAPEDSVPASDLTVTLPYPAGTNARYTFTAVHMFASGPRAGETETPAVTNTDQGITFTVTGLSPVCVGWTAPTSSSSNSRRGNYSVTLPAGSAGGAVTADSASAGRGERSHPDGDARGGVSPGRPRRHRQKRRGCGPHRQRRRDVHLLHARRPGGRGGRIYSVRLRPLHRPGRGRVVSRLHRLRHRPQLDAGRVRHHLRS